MVRLLAAGCKNLRVHRLGDPGRKSLYVRAGGRRSLAPFDEDDGYGIGVGRERVPASAVDSSGRSWQLPPLCRRYGVVVSKPEWGVKRICFNCGARFYDLQRADVSCPKCGTQYDPEAFLKSRRSRPSAAVAEKEPAPIVLGR